MDSQTIVTVVCAILASPVLTKIIESICNKLRNKETQLDRIERVTNYTKSEVDILKIEECRTNLMLLLHSFRNSGDIAKLAKQYVVDYSGDSYLIPLIVEWYDEKDIAYPEWLKKAYDEHNGYALEDHGRDNNG